MRWIKVWIGLCVMVSASTKQYDFNITQGKKASLEVDFENRDFNVKLKDNTLKLNDITEDVMDYEDHFEFSKNIVFDDYNFDGYTDIAILAGVWSGGVTTCRQYYFFDAMERSFYPYKHLICNLESNKASKLLYGSMKSGSSYFGTYHLIGNRGMPIKIIDAFSTWGDEDGDMKTTYTVTSVGVTSKQTLYLVPGEKRLNQSITNGQKLQIIDIFNDKKQPVWFKVSVRQHKDIQGWLPLSVLHFDEIETKKVATVYADKTYFYKVPNGKKTRTYIVYEDQAEVLQIKDEWVQIRYKGKKKSYTAWVKSEDVSIVDEVIVK